MSRNKPVLRRESFALIMLPSTLVIAIYSIFFAYPLAGSHAGAVTALRKAESSAVPQSEAVRSLEQLESVKQGITRLRNRNASGHEQIEELGQQWRDVENRLDTIQLVTETLHSHNLSVVFQRFAKEPEISNYDKSLIQIINAHTPERPLEYWEMEVDGVFPDMAQFLEEFNRELVGIVPLTITMSSPADASGGIKKWKILFLI